VVVAVDVSRGASIFATAGVGEIAPPVGKPVQSHSSSIGVIFQSGNYTTGCTATVLAGTDVVVTAHHCFDPKGPNGPDNTPWVSGLPLEFSPAHSGKCAVLPLFLCGKNPFGVFYSTGADAVQVAIPGGGLTDVEFVRFGGTNLAGKHLSQVVHGLPPTFIPVFTNAFAGQVWKAYGFPTRVGDWNMRTCGPTAGEAGIAPSTFVMPGCTFWHPDSKGPGGASGGPWLSNQYVQAGLGAVTHGTCPPNNLKDCSAISSRSGPWAFASALGYPEMACFVQIVVKAGACKLP
jgi:hypothetical protein